MKLKLTLFNFLWAAIFTAFGGTCATLYFMGLPCKQQTQIEQNSLMFESGKPQLKKAYPVTVTVYHPTVAQCDNTPFVTADGSKIDSKHPQRWCGASRDIIKLVGYGAKINLRIPLAPYLNGIYTIHDTGKADQKMHIDLLISNPDVCNIRGAWKGVIEL